MVGVPPADERRGERLVVVDRARSGVRSTAPGGCGVAARRRPDSLVALGERLAGDEAGGLRRLRGDPGRVRLERQALQRGPDRSWPLCARASRWRPPSGPRC